MKLNGYRTWIFQCNPKRYDLHAYLSEHNYIYWAANQFKDEIKCGDGIFIWRAAAGGFARGIVAFGVVSEEPTKKELVKYPDVIRDDLWSEVESNDAPVVGIKLEDVRLVESDGMILADLLSADDVLSKMTIMRSWFQTNYKITNEEAHVLSELWSSMDVDNFIDYDLMTASEGKLKLAIHFRRERNTKLRDKAKELFKQKHNGKIFCEICGFSFEETYGELGYGYIEAHHVVPIAQMKPGDVTKISDLKMLCSNCHRMAHREHGWELLLTKIKQEN